jgi:hypothetical protein
LRDPAGPRIWTKSMHLYHFCDPDHTKDTQFQYFRLKNSSHPFTISSCIKSAINPPPTLLM